MRTSKLTCEQYGTHAKCKPLKCSRKFEGEREREECKRKVFCSSISNLFMAAMALRSFSCRNWSKACSARRNSLSIRWRVVSSARTSLSRRLASSFFTVNEYFLGIIKNCSLGYWIEAKKMHFQTREDYRIRLGLMGEKYTQEKIGFL